MPSRGKKTMCQRCISWVVSDGQAEPCFSFVILLEEPNYIKLFSKNGFSMIAPIVFSLKVDLENSKTFSCVRRFVLSILGVEEVRDVVLHKSTDYCLVPHIWQSPGLVLSLMCDEMRDHPTFRVLTKTAMKKNKIITL